MTPVIQVGLDAAVAGSAAAVVAGMAVSLVFPGVVGRLGVAQRCAWALKSR